ncbi:uncharacterized protein LOC135950466 [Calliphora vicina]|uniref:uncharacterized protein LOC135950466 n=1 Tax=Calliphora vicina TaxID=7373 RepID=UPI00325BF0AB
MILAVMCFDLEVDSLRVINYNVQYSQNTNAEMIRNMKLNDLLGYSPQVLKTKKSLPLTNELLQQNLKDLSRLNPLVSFADLEVSSIVQGHSYAKYFKEYNDFLNIIWWRNLRLGNWKLFINTLENYAGKNSFQIFTGTSHMLELPLNLTHKQSKKLELKIDSKNLTIPAYIWSYVKSIDGRNQDFIIVGYNSPFAEFFTLKDIIFCPDICSKIPWLEDIHTAFRYTFAGIMFCCSTNFIKITKYLNGFPTDVFDKTFNNLL